MAQQTTVTLVADTWTQLTDANITNITFQVLGNDPVLIMGTATASAPSNTDGAIQYLPGEGEVNRALVDLFLGVTSPVRVYAYVAAGDKGRVVVSHA